MYTYKPETICDDDDDDDNRFYVQGIMEALREPSRSKLACFLELKLEQKLMMEKLKNDIVTKCTGNYCKTHILLDLMNLYKTYTEEFDDETSAFDLEVLNACRETVKCVFELFSCVTDITVFVEATADEEHILTCLLTSLRDDEIVSLVKTVPLRKKQYIR